MIYKLKYILCLKLLLDWVHCKSNCVTLKITFAHAWGILQKDPKGPTDNSGGIVRPPLLWEAEDPVSSSDSFVPTERWSLRPCLLKRNV